MTVDHEDLRSDCALYAVGGLPDSERARLEEHLRTCDECRASVRSFRSIADLLPYTVPLVDPPATLRERLQAAASRARAPRAAAPPLARSAVSVRPRRTLIALSGWAVAAASVFIAIAFGMRMVDLQNRLRETEHQLADTASRLSDADRRVQASTQQVAGVRQMLALVTAADVVELRLVGQAPARQARARAFLSRSRGVLFAASDLPPLTPDRTYQVWYLTRSAPVSAGLIRPDTAGNATATFVVPNQPAIVGMAVSVEPDGGMPAPTGAIYLATQ